MLEQGSIREKVREIILDESPNAQMEDEEDYLSVFSDIGVDSLDLMMVLLRVSETYELEVKEDQFGEIESIQDIVKFVETRLASV